MIIHTKQNSYSAYERDCIVSDYCGPHKEMYSEEFDMNMDRINTLSHNEFEALLEQFSEFNKRNQINFYWGEIINDL